MVQSQKQPDCRFPESIREATLTRWPRSSPTIRGDGFGRRLPGDLGAAEHR